MAAKSNSTGAMALPMPAVIAIVVVALALMGGLAYHYFLAPPASAPMDAQGKANQSVLAGLAKKCKGNYNNLSPDDQATARRMAGGYAAMAIANLYKNPSMGQ